MFREHLICANKLPELSRAHRQWMRMGRIFKKHRTLHRQGDRISLVGRSQQESSLCLQVENGNQSLKEPPLDSIFSEKGRRWEKGQELVSVYSATAIW